MELQVFSASTMAEALQQVKRALGPEAVILHTRTYQRRRWLGLRRRQVVEITATGEPELASRRRLASAGTGPGTSTPTRPRNTLLQTPVAVDATLRGLSQELGALKGMVSELVRGMHSQHRPDVPENLFSYYVGLIQNQVAEELALRLLHALQSRYRPELLCNPQFAREKLAEELQQMLPVSGPIVRRKSTGPHVVALVGPTGVGKTTTIAKLAANLQLREHRRVGLITIDTYRIAAVDQLKKYADILDVPLRVVLSPEELRASLASMSDREFVLIDTTGRSPMDALKLSELKAFLAAARPDEVHLVLSSTASQDCIETAVARFSEVGVDRIIFTKLDEAVHLGVVLNTICRVKKSLSYVTTGQDVPDDIEVGHGRKLAQLILGELPEEAGQPACPQRSRRAGGGL